MISSELFYLKFIHSFIECYFYTFIWTFVKDNIIEENDYYEAIGICVFDYKLFE